MADWATISSIATAGGTLVLAAATYTAVRSSNRSARIAERALLLGLRPVLVSSRADDHPESVSWQGQHHVTVPGGMAHVEDGDDGTVYMAVALRNVGAGLGVLQGSHIRPGAPTARGEHPPLEQFRPQVRDLYIAAGDTGFWQTALRNPDEVVAKDVRAAIAAREPLTVHLLYGDHEGGQLTISLFGLLPTEQGEWNAEVGRHWTLDGPDPRLRLQLSV